MTNSMYGGMTLDIGKLRAELTRVIQGKMTWDQLNHAYLVDLIEIDGISVTEAERVRDGLRFSVKRRGKSGQFRIAETLYGTDVLLEW